MWRSRPSSSGIAPPVARGVASGPARPAGAARTRANKPKTQAPRAPDAHVEAALELIKQGKFEEALQALERLPSPRSARALDTLMGAAAKRGDTRATLRLLAEMKARSLPVGPYGYNHALYACATRPYETADGQGYLAEARALFSEMLAKGPEPTLVNHNTFLLVLGRHGKVAEARALLESMATRGPRPNLVSYNMVLAAAARAGAWPQVQGLLRTMEAEGGVAPDVVSYNTAISTFRQPAAGAARTSTEEGGGGPELGLALLEEMRSRGLAPDTTTYNTLIDVCCKGGRLDAARSLLSAMQAEGHGPDKVTFVMVEGFLRTRRFEEAWAVLEQLQDTGRRRVVLTALAGLGRDADVEARALQLLQAQSKEDIAGRAALETALLAMVGAGRARDGIALVRRLEEKAAAAGLCWASLTADSFTSAIQSCRSLGDVEGAQALLVEAERRDLLISSAIVMPLVKLAGRKAEWRSVVALVEVLERASSSALDLSLHNVRLRALAFLGDAAGCRAALASMRAQGVEPDGDSFSWTLRAEQAGGLANSGGIRRMLHEARAGPTELTQELALAQAAALRRVGDWRGVLALLDRVAAGECPGVRVTTVMANHALGALAQQQQWASSLELIEAMAGGGLGGGAPPDSVTYLHQMVALGQLGRSEEAVALLHRVRDGALGPTVTPQETMYTAAAAACARAGKLAEAQAVHALRAADGFKPTLHSFNSLLQAYARLGRVEEAMAVLERIEAETGEAPDVVSYNSLIQAHRECGTPLLDADGVLGVHRRLLGGHEAGLQPDAATYTALIAACVPAGQWPVALYLYAEAQFIMGGGGRGRGRVLSKAERDGRVLVLRALLTALEHLGVDGFFSSRAYGEACCSWRGCISHWVRQKDGGEALDLHSFSRPMARVALAHVLRRDVVARFAKAEEVAARPQDGRPARDSRNRSSSVRPLVIIVGRGMHSQEGGPLLKEEVQQFLASLDPPLHAVVPPYNAGRLVVSAGQMRAYVEAQVGRRRKRSQVPAVESGQEEGDEVEAVGVGL